MKKRIITSLLMVSATMMTSVVSAQQIVAPDLWITDGRVRALSVDGDRMYLGGDFGYIGPRTGSGVEISAVTGEPDNQTALLDGIVETVISDSSGGWYVGGSRNLRPGGKRAFFTHILADGTLDTSSLPQPDGAVHSLLLIGKTLYLGGKFTTIGGEQRRRVAAIDVASGTLLPWNPQIDGAVVYDLEPFNDELIIAGRFKTVGGNTRRNIALVNQINGNVLAWRANTNSVIRDVSAHNGVIYFGGSFTRVRNQPRDRLAAVDGRTGEVLPWTPSSSGNVNALVVSGNTVYVGGIFSSINQQSRVGAAAIDASNGQLLPWNTQLNVNSVRTLAVNNDSIYLGGNFKSAAAQSRVRLAEVDLITGTLTDWSPDANGDVHAIAVEGERVFVGGNLQSVGGDPRGFGAALDLTTGIATAWDPRANGSIVDIEVAGDTVFAVGGFNNVGGARREYAAELDAETATTTAWQAPPVSFPDLNTVAVTPEKIYIGGLWASIGGRFQPSIAELDRETGALTTTSLFMDFPSAVNELVYDAKTSRLYIGGSYNTINGISRPALSAFDVSTGTVVDWDPQIAELNAEVNAIDIAGDTVFFGGNFIGVAGEPRENLAAVSAITGAVLPWIGPPPPLGDVREIEVGENAVYIGGDFVLSVNGRKQQSAMALDPITGRLLNWRPNPPSNQQGSVFDIELIGSNAAIAGEYKRIAREVTRSIAIIKTLEK